MKLLWKLYYLFVTPEGTAQTLKWARIHGVQVVKIKVSRIEPEDLI